MKTKNTNSVDFINRQNTIRDALQDSELEAFVFNAGPSLRYFTGLDFHLMERPVILIISQEKDPCFVLPDFEKGKLNSISFAHSNFSYDEDPQNWDQSFSNAVSHVGLDGLNVGVEDTRLRFLEMGFLQKAAPAAKFMSGNEMIANIRERKGATEIASMRKAAQLAEQALENTLKEFKPGQTEKEIASRLVAELLALGSDPELPFFPIVAGGPNSANPHATPTDRPVQEGDLLLVDWGASVDAYFSDITRTFAVGEVEPELLQIHETVRLANEAARKQVQLGVTCSSIDKAARDVIEDSGYGQFFTHRTGHGLGLEAHETPYIRDGNEVKLQAGMTFTIEPGIYLEGRGGVRIEDNIAVTADGGKSLTSFPRKIRTLG